MEESILFICAFVKLGLLGMLPAVGETYPGGGLGKPIRTGKPPGLGML